MFSGESKTDCEALVREGRMRVRDWFSNVGNKALKKPDCRPKR